MKSRAVHIVGLFVVVLGLSACSSEDENARERIEALEQQVLDLSGRLGSSSIAVDLGDLVEDRGLGLTIRRIWVESDSTGEFLRLVADVELTNAEDFPQKNRFKLIAVTDRGEVHSLGTFGLAELAAREIEKWDVVPADSTQRGYVYSVDYRSAEWSFPQPLSQPLVYRDLLAIEELLVMVEGSARLHRVRSEPEEGEIVPFVAPMLGSSEPTTTFEFWTTYLLGSGGEAPVTFNAAGALSRLAGVVAIGQTGYSTTHPQTIACERWILAGTDSPSDCSLERQE